MVHAQTLLDTQSLWNHCVVASGGGAREDDWLEPLTEEHVVFIIFSVRAFVLEQWDYFLLNLLSHFLNHRIAF